MRRTPRVLTLLACAALAHVAFACRPDPGDYDYASQEDFSDTESRISDGDPGPDPYVDGTARLSFGIFYEGPASRTLPVDGLTRHYYVYDDTYAQSPDSDHVEGGASDVIVHAGGSWWAGGITWDAAEDLSDWTTLVVGLKSADEGFASVDIAMESEGPNGPTAPLTRAVVSAGDHGYQNDGQWHLLRIPLAAFTGGGVDLTVVRQPFGLAGGPSESGARLHVDSVYLTQE